MKLISLREGFDLSTPAGKMMLHMMAGFAEMEKSIIAMDYEGTTKINVMPSRQHSSSFQAMRWMSIPYGEL